MKDKTKAKSALLRESKSLRKRLGNLENIKRDLELSERALRDCEVKFQSIAEGSVASIFIFQGTKFRYANRTMMKMTGFSKEELLAMDFWEIVHPDHRKLIKRRGLTRLRGGSPPRRYEYKIVTKSGEERWVEGIARIIRFEGKRAISGSVFDITERKWSELECERQRESLRESEERYRSLFTYSPDPIYVHIEERVTLVNPAMCHLLGGNEPSQLIGKSVFEIVHPDYHEKIRERWKGIFGGQPAPLLEEKFIRLDGTVADVEVSAVAVDWQGSKQVQVIVRDITERKGAEQALRESEERLHAALDAAAIGIWEWDLDTNEIVSFGHHDRILGFEPGNFDGTLPGFQRCVHPDDYEELEKVVIVAREESTEYNHEFRVLWPDGTIRWISAKGRFTYADSGRPTKMCGYLVDITERKKAEETLQQSEAKLRQAQQLAGIGYWERDPVNDRILWSEGISEILALPYRSASLTQAEVQEFIHPDDQQLQRDALTDALKGRQSYDVEYRVIRSNGDIRLVHVRDEVEYDSSMRPIRLFGTMQDITERKQAEEKIRQYAARMEVLARVSGAMAECRQDVQVELDTIALQTASLVGDGSIIALLAPDGKGYEFAAHHHRDSGILKVMEEARSRMPIIDVGSAWTARVLKTGEGLLVSEVDPEEAKQVVPPLLLKYFQSFLAVPLRFEGRVIGLLTIFRSKHGQSYTPDDQVLLQDLADRAALIIQNARLFKQVEAGRVRSDGLSRRLLDVQEEERRSLARELHDELGQQLTAITFVLENLKLEIRDSHTVEKISEASSMVNDLLQKARSIALDLRPSMLDEFGLASALRWYVKRQAEVARLNWSVSTGPERHRYANDIETACFRIAQEAVTNVLRHAGAKLLVVELKEEHDDLHLYVRDDGCGFDVARARSAATSGKSLGIINMEERVSILGGSLEITSTQVAGTEIHVSLPLHMKTTLEKSESETNEDH